MADLSPRPKRAATPSEERVAELHQLADADYASTAHLRAQGVRLPLASAPAALAPYAPLHDPERTLPRPFDLDVEIAVTRQILAETASLNIHSDADMQQAAFSLNARIRHLLAAIDAERGESR